MRLGRFDTRRVLGHAGRAVLLAALACASIGCDTPPAERPDETVPPGRRAQRPTNPFLPSATDDRGWPFIRGGDYDGRSTEINLADSWPPAGPPVVWARSLGQGYSGLVVAGSRVYTQTQSLTGQHVECLDADTGRTLWQYRYEGPYEPTGRYPGPRATPTYSAGKIYFAAPSGLVGCLSAGDGSHIWSLNVKEKFDGKGTDFGYSCSPTVEGGKVFLPVGGKGAAMVALDALDGSVEWTSGDDPASYTPAYPITLAGRRLIVGYMQNGLVGFDAATGKQLWRVALSLGYDEHAAWPLYREPLLLISGPFRDGSRLLDLSGDGEQAPKTLWTSDVMSNDIFSSILVGDEVYGFDLRDVQAKADRPSRGTFRCLDLASGDERWATDEIGHANVLAADGKLILFNDRGELILARATAERYDELARARVFEGEICWTPPALSRGRVYLRNQSQAVCLYVGKPELLEGPPLEPISLADMPKSRRFELAKMLAIEPAYTTDVPSLARLWSWYAFSLLGVLGTAGLVAGVARLASASRLGGSGTWWLFWTLAFLLGATATTALSSYRSQLIFTWPACTFVAFQAAVFQSRWSAHRGNVRRGRLRSYLVGSMFLVVCLTYFLLC